MPSGTMLESIKTISDRLIEEEKKSQSSNSEQKSVLTKSFLDSQIESTIEGQAVAQLPRPANNNKAVFKLMKRTIIQTGPQIQSTAQLLEPKPLGPPLEHKGSLPKIDQSLLTSSKLPLQKNESRLA